MLNRTHHFRLSRRPVLEYDHLEGRRGFPRIPAVLRIQPRQQRFFLRRLEPGRENLFASNPLGVGEHHQQMPAIECVNVVIANARMIRQHEWIGDTKKLPRDKTLALTAFQPEHIHHPLMKNLRTHQPPPRRRPRLGLYLAAEELLVIDVIPVARIPQLLL